MSLKKAQSQFPGFFIFLSFLVFFLGGLRKKGAFLDIPRASVLYPRLNEFYCVMPFNTQTSSL